MNYLCTQALDATALKIQFKYTKKENCKACNDYPESLFDVYIQVEIFSTTHQTIASEGQQCSKIYQLTRN